MSVVKTSLFSFKFVQEKHNANAYHHVQEAIASKVKLFALMIIEENMSDILTKPLHEKLHCMLEKAVF
jgi:hypothetical protein